tara:strand:- start:2047 stop:2805 length:759 start_codon:yes stop_codon:yes gene_type:complete
MIQCGPYGPNHATAGTFAFRKELLNSTRYNDDAALAEEKAFLKDYTVPFVQLDPLKSILVFSHEHNTYDKRKMFDNAHKDYFKESDKTVDTFIKYDSEKPIKQFFMKNIDKLLKNYDPGLPSMKPDVMEQIKVIEDNRDKMIKEMREKQQNGPIMLNEEGKPPRQLNNSEIVQIIQNHQANAKKFNEKLTEMNNTLGAMQSQLIEVSMRADTLQNEKKELTEENKKLKEEIALLKKELPKEEDKPTIFNIVD